MEPRALSPAPRSHAGRAPTPADWGGILNAGRMQLRSAGSADAGAAPWPSRMVGGAPGDAFFPFVADSRPPPLYAVPPLRSSALKALLTARPPPPRSAPLAPPAHMQPEGPYTPGITPRDMGYHGGLGSTTSRSGGGTVDLLASGVSGTTAAASTKRTGVFARHRAELEAIAAAAAAKRGHDASPPPESLAVDYVAPDKDAAGSPPVDGRAVFMGRGESRADKAVLLHPLQQLKGGIYLKPALPDEKRDMLQLATTVAARLADARAAIAAAGADRESRLLESWAAHEERQSVGGDAGYPGLSGRSLLHVHHASRAGPAAVSASALAQAAQVDITVMGWDQYRQDQELLGELEDAATLGAVYAEFYVMCLRVAALRCAEHGRSMARLLGGARAATRAGAAALHASVAAGRRRARDAYAARGKYAEQLAREELAAGAKLLACKREREARGAAIDAARASLAATAERIAILRAAKPGAEAAQAAAMRALGAAREALEVKEAEGAALEVDTLEVEEANRDLTQEIQDTELRASALRAEVAAAEAKLEPFVLGSPRPLLDDPSVMGMSTASKVRSLEAEVERLEAETAALAAQMPTGFGACAPETVAALRQIALASDPESWKASG